MLSVLFALALLGPSAAYEATLDHFAVWAFDHGKFYTDAGEHAMRQMVWLDNAQFVAELNAKHDSANFSMNHFGDMTHEEYLATLSPIDHDVARGVMADMTAADLPDWVSVPAAMDWRTKGAVTHVKNQGSCGSCYAFSTTGAIEGACAIKNKAAVVSLSEQQVMDCSWEYGNNGCHGGMFDRAFYYVQRNGGIDSEQSYMYTMQESHECKYNPANKAGSVSNFYYVKQFDEDALVGVLAFKGPVAIAINAGARSMQFYRDGVYDEPDCNPMALNHGVLAIGYGQEGGKDYFLVKNSWGTQWGMGGYIKMRRNANNQCGIVTYPSIPDC